MGVELREADTNADSQIITKTVSLYLTCFPDPKKRYDWLYKNNPHGRVRSWIATDKNKVIGVSSVFPRQVFVNRNAITAWVLGDFCISSEHRSLGTALQLQRTLLNELDLGTVPFCYDFPSIGMMAVYRRLAISPHGQMIRMARPLRIDRQVEKYFKSEKAVRGITSVGNRILKLWAWQRTSPSGVCYSLLEGPCSEEFTILSREIRDNYGICVFRSAEYLNWRFLENPYCRYQILTARRSGVLLGYAIFTVNDRNGAIVDLFGFNEDRTLSDLIASVIRIFQNAGVITASVALLSSHPWVPMLESSGFRKRETKPLVVYPSRLLREISQANLFLMDGDRDS